jgi:MFS family permease
VNKDQFLLFKHFPVSRELMLDMNRIVLGASLGLIFFGAFNGAPFSGFIRSLGVNDFMYGVLMSLSVMGGLFQLLAAYVLERTGARKRLFLISGVVQRIVVIPMVILPYILPPEWKPLLIGLVMLLLASSAVGSSLNGVTFFSWMADVIPMQIRGKFFSIRQMFFTFSSMLGGLAVGYLLDLIGGRAGFLAVFVITSILGLLDIACFIKVADPPMKPHVEKIQLMQVWKEAFQHPNFRKYLTFWSVWIFAISISGPFFNDYMLNYLHMPYLEITLFTGTLNIVTILVVRMWGNFIDEYGNKPILYICGVGVIFLPVLWLFSTPQAIGIILVIQIISGFFWCGIELTSNNLMMGLSPEENRSFYIASFSMVTAVMGSVLAYITGGLLMELTRGRIESLRIMLMGYPLNNYHLLFILSTLLRAAAIFIFLPKVVEEGAHSPLTLIRDKIWNKRTIQNKSTGSSL